MKCSDCNGIIEGKRPFCPHCGRKLGGAASAGPQIARRVIGAQPAPVSGIASAAERLMQRNLSVKDAQEARAALEKMRSGMPSGLQIRLVKMFVFIMVGAMIGGALPGNRWIAGAMIGLFLGLPKKISG
ncbi:MAG: hypothetical protein AB7U35_10045 [Sphingobium sp.]